jgi:hypothetical protein
VVKPLAGCTNGAHGTNGSCETVLISTKDKLQFETCVMTKSNSPDEDIPKVVFDSDSSNGGEDSLVTFSGFSDPGERFAIMNKRAHCHHPPAIWFCPIRC